MNEVPNSGGSVVFGDLGHPLLDRIIQGEVPCLDRMQKGGSRELLSHRTQIEVGTGRDGQPVVQVGQSVPRPVRQLVVGHHAQGTARAISVDVGVGCAVGVINTALGRKSSDGCCCVGGTDFNHPDYF